MKDDITFRMDGEKMSKNRYFFGGELKSAMKTKTTRESKENRKSRKTAVDIFLEDQGPYSRKLYGPPPATQESGSGPENMKQKTTKTRPRSQEALLNSSSASNGALAENPIQEGDDGVLKKGLLWQQRDKLFSRWKERYFILTKDYFHCFKKATSRITEMGGFIFKLKLTEVETIELLDKRGYLTICISLIKDGKIYLRRPEGIRDWFTALQNNIYECKRRRKFWVKRQVTDSANIEHWLLARQKLSGYTYSSGSSPNILDSSSNGVDSNNKISDEVDNDNSNNNNKMQNHHHPPPSGPRAVSRSAMVKAVVASESLEQPENHGVDKPVKNVCLVDTPQIFPSGNAMTTRAVIESTSGSSNEYNVAPNHPKGINRMSLVNELISREKSEHHQHQQTCQESTEEGAMSSSSSIMAESSAKSNSARSSMQSTTASNSSSSSSGMTPTNDNNNNSTRLDDSSNDSGHNSMNTNSSDSQSDGTNSGGEEKSTNTSKSLPSSKSLNNTIKITNSGHSMKIHVDGGNFTTNNGKRMVEVDVDQILKPNVGERPALLPRPPSSLTKPSIMKYRGKQTS